MPGWSRRHGICRDWVACRRRLSRGYLGRHLASDAHNSTALEGNTLVLREVEELLDRGRAVGSKDLKDYLEVLGYGRAARWVYSQALRRRTGTTIPWSRSQRFSAKAGGPRDQLVLRHRKARDLTFGRGA